MFATYKHMNIHQLYWSPEAIDQLRYGPTLELSRLLGDTRTPVFCSSTL